MITWMFYTKYKGPKHLNTLVIYNLYAIITEYQIKQHLQTDTFAKMF